MAEDDLEGEPPGLPDSADYATSNLAICTALVAAPLRI